MERVTYKCCLFFAASIFSSAITAETFDSPSYYRQQNAADSAFEEFDKEFAKPEKPSPAPVAPELVHEHHTSEIRATEPTGQRQAEQLFASPEPLEINGFKFDLTSCKLQNRNVRCDINIISFDSDRMLTIINNWSSHSSFYDNQGNQFNVSTLRLGNKEMAGKNLSGKLINGITTKLSVVFENVSSQTTAVSLLDLDAQASNRKFKVQFRNIPLI